MIKNISKFKIVQNKNNDIRIQIPCLTKNIEKVTLVAFQPDINKQVLFIHYFISHIISFSYEIEMPIKLLKLLNQKQKFLLLEEDMNENKNMITYLNQNKNEESFHYEVVNYSLLTNLLNKH